MSIPCNNYVVPILETDPCNGSRVGAGCVIDETIYSELGLSQNATQQEINQAVYLAYLNLKATTEAQDLAITLIDGSETKIEAGDNITITGSGTEGTPYVINSSGGSSVIQDLQSVIDEGGYAEVGDSYIAIFDGDNAMHFAASDGINLNAAINLEPNTMYMIGSNSSTNYVSQLSIDDGNFNIRQTKSNFNTFIKFEDPVAENLGATILIPAKPEGAYTLATTDQLRPYTVYTATLNQEGTADPTTTVFENTIGNIVWTRVTDGLYFGTLAGAFPVDKTHLSIAPSSPTGSYSIFRNTDNIIVVKTQDNGTTPFTDSDDKLFNNSIEIKIYN